MPSLAWVQEEAEFRLYHKENPKWIAAITYDETMATMLCRRYNAMAGVQDLDALGELLNRMPSSMYRERDRDLWERALGKRDVPDPDTEDPDVLRNQRDALIATMRQVLHMRGFEGGKAIERILWQKPLLLDALKPYGGEEVPRG